jgi:putative membrane protein
VGFATSFLLRWTFDPLVVLPLALAGILYVEGIRNVRRLRPGSGWPPSRTAWFFGGLGLLVIALASPVDFYSDRFFSVHMAQHVAIMMVAAPCLLLGRPITLALMASSPPARKNVIRVTHSRLAHVLGSPVLGLGLFAAVLWAAHFSGLYDAALTNNIVHAGEHIAFLTAALLFWWPIVARDPGSARLSYPARLFYVFLAMPVMSLLGLVISMSDHVLYAHYTVTAAASGISALADQQLGGTIMWGSSMVIGTIALSAVLIDWMDRDEKEAVRMDERLARQAGRAPRPVRPDVEVVEPDPGRA